MQAEEDLGIARPFIDVVQSQAVRALKIARRMRPGWKAGESFVRCAQDILQMVYPPAMNAPSKAVPQKDAPQDGGRAERLAAALRENLRRRKAQARAKQDAAKPEIQPPKSPRK